MENVLSRLDQILQRYSFKISQGDWQAIQSEIQRMQQEPLHVVMIGEFSSGKSSLINALIGRPILPVSVSETTLTTFEVMAVPPGSKEACYRPDGSEVPLAGIAQLNQATKQRILVNVGCDLPAGVKFVDTPGLASLNAILENISREALEKADVIALLANIQSGADKYLLDFFQRYPSFAEKIVLILTHADVKSPAEREEMRAHVRQRVAATSIEAVLVASVCLDREPAGLDEVKQFLFQEIFSRVPELRQKNIAKKSRQLASRMLANLKPLRESAQLDSAGIEAKIAAASQDRERCLREISQKTDRLIKEIRREGKDCLKRFKKRALLQVEKELDHVLNGNSHILQLEIEHIWDDEAGKLQQKIEDMVEESRPELANLAVKMELSFLLQHMDVLTMVAATVLSPLPGIGNIIEAIVGKYVGNKLKKLQIVRNIARNQLIAALEEGIIEADREIQNHLQQAEADIGTAVKAELLPRLDEFEQLLAQLRRERQKSREEYQAFLGGLDQDIRLLGSLTAES